MFWTYRLWKDYPLVIRFILSCPILCPDIYIHIHGTTAVCLSCHAVLSSCQKECTNIQALSESPLKVWTLSTRVGTPCPWFHCFWVFGGVRALTPPKLGGDMDTMSPDQHASRKCRNPSCSPNFLSGDQARGTREIVTSRTSPRTLLLHMPLTDLLRQIYRLADSRSGTLESPSGRFFDPRVEGVWQLLPLRSLFFICPCRSLLSPEYCLSLCCHTLRRCSSIVRTLFSRREKWGHYPPAVLTRKSYIHTNNYCWLVIKIV